MPSLFAAGKIGVEWMTKSKRPAGNIGIALKKSEKNVMSISLIPEISVGVLKEISFRKEVLRL